ncbi:MAG TPA: hypothetical protein VEL28_09125 [Candidatus Binatia bacterium]|nr:hypothetical protein [Candidatus Binatia bacterium]
MTIRSINFVKGAVGAAVLVALAAAPAAAQLDDGATDCRATIAKGYSKLVSTAAKTITGCHKARNGGKILDTVDCNSIADADAAKGKIAGAQAKLVESIVEACGAETELLSTEYYFSCPAPCASASPNPIPTIGDLADCLACLGPELVAATSADTLDTPTPASMSKDDQKCHAAIAKSYPKYVSTLLKGRHGCQGDEDAEGRNDLDVCDEIDVDGKGAAALAKNEAGLEKSCALANLTNVASCATNMNDLKNCLQEEYDALALSSFTTTYELPATICPTGVRSTIRAGKSVDGDTNSTLSVGWTGLGHYIDIPDKYAISSDLDCPGTEAGSCGDCTVLGISATDPESLYSARCVENVQQSCTNPFGDDLVNCVGAGYVTNDCGYYLGTPLPTSAGGTPTCTMNRLFTNVTGTANPDTGESDLNLDLRAVVHLGGSQSRPCPICVGDPVAQDGLRQGTCTGGHSSINGDICDVQAFDKSYSTNGYPQVSGLSLDCPPHSLQNFSGSGLIIDLPLSTGPSSKPFGDACDGTQSHLSCACGVCNDGVTPCENDAECGSLGLGLCGQGDGPERAPNACDGFVCNDDAGLTDRGSCFEPLERYCDGFTKANGRGIIPCSSNGDCDNVTCPGAGCGDCELLQVKSCFLDPIEIEGIPSTTNPVLAGLFCLPPTSNSGINSAAGSPGPGAVKVDMLVDLLYD